jgi:cyanate lyase
MSDGESDRAMIAATLWAGMTATERAKKTVASLLPVADDLLKRSYALGSPVSGENPDVIYIDPTPFSVLRFREWLSRQSAELTALYADVVT